MDLSRDSADKDKRLNTAKFLQEDIAKLAQKRDLLDEQVLKGLARRYHVSVQALTFRLANLGYIKLHP
jgi:Zn-dependent peptidase ImmA (M78 family)